MPKYVITAGQVESAKILRKYGVPMGLIGKILGVKANSISVHLRHELKNSPRSEWGEIVRALRQTARTLEAIGRAKEKVETLPGFHTGVRVPPEITPNHADCAAPFQSDKAR